ncbi:MAG: Gfo/Idh/MocA family oxidoreductase [Burkholderiales bacterium]|nr:Gfo/Idh/MocA family oxidoreductase [Burkholderiales bacterium]
MSQNNSTKRIRIGVIGLGWVSIHRHIPALIKNPAFEIVGVADRQGNKAREVAAKFGFRHASEAHTLADISWINEVDAIDVVTSPMEHYHYIRDALEHNLHVITEKPFAMTVEQGTELVALSQQKKLCLAIVHNFQFASSALKLKQAIAENRLGTIRSISAFQWGNPGRRLPTWYQELPQGLFFDESPHLLYLVRALSKGNLSMKSVESFVSTTGNTTPASIDAFFHGKNGENNTIPVSISCRFEAPISEWYVSVLGDKAVGMVDIFRDIYIELPNDGDHTSFKVLRTSWRATLMHWMRHFVNGPLHFLGKLEYGNDEVFGRFERAIRSNSAPADIDAVDALAVLKLQHQIMQMAAQSQQKIG